MLRWIIPVVIVLSVVFAIEFYAFQAFRTVTKNRWFLTTYLVVSALLVCYIFYSILTYNRSDGQTQHIQHVIGLIVVILVPKIILVAVMFGEDIFRMIQYGFQYFTGNSKDISLPGRRKFVSQIALGLAAIPFSSIIYGIFVGKYNFKVHRQQVFFADLPDAFDGFKITQISDVHSGSFDNKEKIEYAIDLVNQQDGDIILFTGDIVNTFATEMHPWIETFNRIRPHKYGKYSVLGNHDYGEYVEWHSQAAKDKNFEDIKKLYGQIGFDLLLNEHTFIEKGGEKIALVGVENWGIQFKKAGDLQKASEGLTNEDFKVLMSHDPSHWEYEIRDHLKNFQLTLAGHTHGFQFGIEIPGFIKWSPVKYAYKQWAGLYENLGRYIYVNRGFGFHAFPGRVGIWPEITVIELKKGGKAA